MGGLFWGVVAQISILWTYFYRGLINKPVQHLASVDTLAGKKDLKQVEEVVTVVEKKVSEPDTAPEQQVEQLPIAPSAATDKENLPGDDSGSSFFPREFVEGFKNEDNTQQQNLLRKELEKEFCSDELYPEAEADLQCLMKEVGFDQVGGKETDLKGEQLEENMWGNGYIWEREDLTSTPGPTPG